MKYHFTWDQVPILLAICENEILLYATFITGYLIFFPYVLTFITLNIISFIFFQNIIIRCVKWGQAGIHNWRNRKKKFVGARAQEESRAATKGHIKEDLETM